VQNQGKGMSDELLKWHDLRISISTRPQFHHLGSASEVPVDSSTASLELLESEQVPLVRQAAWNRLDLVRHGCGLPTSTNKRLPKPAITNKTTTTPKPLSPSYRPSEKYSMQSINQSIIFPSFSSCRPSNRNAECMLPNVRYSAENPSQSTKYNARQGSEETWKTRHRTTPVLAIFPAAQCMWGAQQGRVLLGNSRTTTLPYLTLALFRSEVEVCHCYSPPG